ncbi:hypothetical protein ABID47_005886 [Paenibacillus favisporus]|uniref:Uncharacterized protein n=1 Tax=Paenibacillus favisporus TaxID=221028 RepID=A0ABV2FBV7_9BACL
MKTKSKIVSIVAAFMLVFGATSAFAETSDSVSIQNLVNYESEPNDSYETADTAVNYNMDWGTNQGYINRAGDIDFWHLLTSNAASYTIDLLSPQNFDFNFVVLEKIPGQEGYTEVARSNSQNSSARLTVPGIKSDGSVPNYYVMVYGQYGSFNTTSPYTLAITPEY